ncbi:MAG: Uma2 family endonuclease [Armatimonadetes bacterium]|nr:Uma2 family endonuclease [Armatimonadota bacterium]
MAQATTTLMTVEEFERLPDNGVRCELVRGEVIEMTPSAAESGRIGSRIAIRLGAFVEAHELGITYIPEAGFRLARDPDTVRVPDVAFVTKRRAGLHPPVEGCFPGAPDLAVEVLSPTDRMADVLEKVEEYLAAGTQIVWVVVPTRREVYVYRPAGAVEVVGADGTLAGEPVIPGLSIAVAEIFAH